MSSHHIIRENQEAAIFLVHKEVIEKTVLESFFEWSPLILATEECFLLLHQWGFKIDALLCNIGFEENFATELAIQQPVTIIRVHHQAHVVKEGLHYLKEKNCPAVNIFVNNEGVWNDPQINLGDRGIVIVRQNERGLHVNSGTYEKWQPARSKIRLIPDQADQLFIFKYRNLSTYKQKVNAELVINLEREGLFSISSSQSFQVWEPL